MTSALSIHRLAGLPGEELVRKGLEDLVSGKITQEACLASIASPRLSRCGLLSSDAALVPEAELVLYRLLSNSEADPYARYNSLLRRLVSFEHALDHLAPL